MCKKKDEAKLITPEITAQHIDSKRIIFPLHATKIKCDKFAGDLDDSDPEDDGECYYAYFIFYKYANCGNLIEF